MTKATPRKQPTQIDLEEAIANARPDGWGAQLEKFIVNHRGARYETPDPTPFAPTVNIPVPETIEEKMRRIIRDEISYNMATAGRESFEEADDFDVDDEHDPFSAYELPFEAEFEPPVPRAAAPNPVDPPKPAPGSGKPAAEPAGKMPPAAPPSPEKPA